MQVGEKFVLVGIEAGGEGNWGWPTCLVLTLLKEDGEQVAAVVQVENWRKISQPLHRDSPATDEEQRS